jgi:hypothetical protein
VTLLRDVSTAHARTGDAFEVETVERAYGPHGVVIPEASRGGGVIALAQRANIVGKGGELVLDVRYVSGPRGEHIPATVNWVLAERAPYASQRHGSDITVPRATRMLVVLGDGVADGTCRITLPPPDGPALPIPPPPTPVPATTPAPSPQPTASEDYTKLPTFAATPTPEPESTESAEPMESAGPEPTESPAPQR